MQALLSSIAKHEHSRVLYLNCGIDNVSKPEMARRLRNLGRQLPSVLGMRGIKAAASQLGTASKFLALGNAALNVAVPGKDVLNAFMADFFPEDKATELSAVLNAYGLLLLNIPRSRKEPVIVIDEINALRSWNAEDKGALRHLLEFFKRMCKERGAAHVIYASSDPFIVWWLYSSKWFRIQKCFSV
jgi:hypothetical protein